MKMEAMKYIIKLDGVKDYSVDLVGGKGLNLNLLNQKGFTTPTSSVLSATVFQDLILKILKFNDINFDNIFDESKRLQETIQITKLTDDINEELFKFIEESKSSKYAVRSSAPMEDGETNSFAGQFDSVLNVTPSLENMQKAIKDVWSSLYSIRALSYCIANKIDISSLKMAVVLQSMIETPDVAGTLFTYDIKKSSKDTICIQAVNGLGDQVVDGSGNVSTYTIRKTHIDTDLAKLGSSIIEKTMLKALTNSSLSIEKAFQTFQDIEWAISNKEIYFLQTRPITTI